MEKGSDDNEPAADRPVAAEAELGEVFMTYSQRIGLWILIGVSAFEIGFPVLCSTNSSPKYVQLALMPLALLALAGYRWPRVIAIFVSAGLAMYFWRWSQGDGAILREITGPDDWRAARFIALAGTVPAVGYSVCAVLLSLPWADEWQQFIRPIAVQKRRSAHSPQQSTSDDGSPKKACIWCEQVVVSHFDEYCPSCGRPV